MGLFSEMMDEASEQSSRIAELEAENTRLRLIVESDDNGKAVAEYEWERANKLAEENARLREDAARFRALMRCGRIKPQGSAGVAPKTGERTYPEQPGFVHFGAEFWVQPEAEPSNMTIWGRHCLRALADDILAFEAATPRAAAE